ncbi:MAG: hypothetical protein IT437_10465 [Phycisphaerales bacterium]|nr:hypothetical protein [Phycisphaerales bacterium]
MSIYADNEANEKIEARKGLRGWCPGCTAEMIPKVGRIVVPHWAHSVGNDCDPWYEPETKWHYLWKRLVRPEFAEVIMRAETEWHRADMVGKGGRVIELQRSSITGDEVVRRNAFYNARAGWPDHVPRSSRGFGSDDRVCPSTASTIIRPKPRMIVPQAGRDNRVAWASRSGLARVLTPATGNEALPMPPKHMPPEDVPRSSRGLGSDDRACPKDCEHDHPVKAPDDRGTRWEGQPLPMAGWP